MEKRYKLLTAWGYGTSNLRVVQVAEWSRKVKEALKTGEDDTHTHFVELFAVDSVAGELGQQGSSLDLVEILQTGDTRRLAALGLADGTAEQALQSMRNVRDVAEDMFINGKAEEKLSVDYIKKLHKAVTKGVLPSAGELRIVSVSAAGCSVMYSAPRAIKQHLTELVALVNREMTLIDKETDLVDRTRRRLLLGVFLFSEFLLVHPFKDGNGRLARVLLSWLLRKEVVVPLRIAPVRKRAEYIAALEQRVEDMSRMRPSVQLAEFVLDQAVGWCYEGLSALNIENEAASE